MEGDLDLFLADAFDVLERADAVCGSRQQGAPVTLPSPCVPADTQQPQSLPPNVAGALIRRTPECLLRPDGGVQWKMTNVYGLIVPAPAVQRLQVLCATGFCMKK